MGGNCGTIPDSNVHSAFYKKGTGYVRLDYLYSGSIGCMNQAAKSSGFEALNTTIAGIFNLTEPYICSETLMIDVGGTVPIADVSSQMDLYQQNISVIDAQLMSSSLVSECCPPKLAWIGLYITGGVMLCGFGFLACLMKDMADRKQREQDEYQPLNS